MIHLERIGKNAIVSAENVAFTFEVTDNPREFKDHRNRTETLDWSNDNSFIGNWRIHPFGNNDDLPTVIKDIVLTNHVSSGTLNKQVNMLWGKGPKLFLEDFDEEGELIYNWQNDKEIAQWLKSWDADAYVYKCVVDYVVMKGVFSKPILTKGSRIGNNFISKLEHVLPDRARLASHLSANERLPTHVINTDYKFEDPGAVLNAKVYPIFNPLDPFRHRTSIFYSNAYSFCTEFYTVPELYGSLEWIKRSTAVPLIFKALSDNSINVKYHIESPQYFWDDAIKKLKDNCTSKGIDYKDEYFLEYQKNYLQKITAALSGIENVGKFIHTSIKLEVDGTNLLTHGWKISRVDQNVKDYVDSQLKISERADQVIASTTGVHSSITNTGNTGKVDSGGEQYHALNNFLATSVDVPEMIILKALNYAIQSNFNTDLKLGFYHLGTKKMEDTTPAERNPKA